MGVPNQISENGTFLLFVNSGDLLTKNALKIIYELFSKNKKVDFIFGTVKRHYTTNTIIKYIILITKIN